MDQITSEASILVMNALDNLSARRHVNRLCLASGVPLIESGTAGYLGQVSVHLKVQRDFDLAMTVVRVYRSATSANQSLRLRLLLRVPFATTPQRSSTASCGQSFYLRMLDRKVSSTQRTQAPLWTQRRSKCCHRVRGGRGHDGTEGDCLRCALFVLGIHILTLSHRRGAGG